MPTMTRRTFMRAAAVLGATAAWSRSFAAPSTVAWRERRDLYPEGVASGDPDSHSVLFWTRRPPHDGGAVHTLKVEVAEDDAFTRVVLPPTGAPTKSISKYPAA